MKNLEPIFNTPYFKFVQNWTYIMLLYNVIIVS